MQGDKMDLKIDSAEFAHNHLRSSAGLFQQRRNLTAPRHLSQGLSFQGTDNIHETVPLVKENEEELRSSARFTAYYPEQWQEREVASLEEKVAEYNRKVPQMFKLTPVQGTKGEIFEGALRFYVNDAQRKLSKAVRLRNTDTVACLLPVVREKFGFLHNHSTTQLFIVQANDKEEVALKEEARPLQIAIQESITPRFVIRVQASHNQYSRLSDNRKLVKIGRQGALTGSKLCPDTQNSIGTPCSDNSKLQQLCSKHESRSSLRHPLRITSNRNRTKTLTRSKSEGRLKKQRPPILKETDDLLMPVNMERRGSRQQVVAMENKDGGEFNPPAARIIENRRRKKRDRSLDEKAMMERRTGSLRSSRSKSVSNIFQKSFSLRKKDNPMLPRTELSTEDTPPGVLRIFGPAISPGTQYKSVLASSNSTAELLVKEALDRYTISRDYARHFVLCDVIGQFVVAPSVEDGNQYIDGVWQEDCIRIIGDNERPLILQSFWKPSEGYSRRFELRNRGEFVSVENFEYKPYANNNDKSAANANNLDSTGSESETRRSRKSNKKPHKVPKLPSNPKLQELKADSQTTSLDLESSTSSAADLALIRANMQQIVDTETDFEISHQSNAYRNLRETHTRSSPALIDANQVSNEQQPVAPGSPGVKDMQHTPGYQGDEEQQQQQQQQEPGSPGTSVHQVHGHLGASVTGADSSNISRMTNDTPFIITLKGYEPEKDNIVHFLSKETTVIGCDMLKLGSHDICLPANDILSLHCRVNRDPTQIGHCSVVPCQGALVKINNRPILQCTQVLPGDIIALGNQYIFMFRNPPIEKNVDQNSFAFVKLLNGGPFESDYRLFNHPQASTVPLNNLDKTPEPPPKPAKLNIEPHGVSEWRRKRLEQYNCDNKRLKLTYNKDKEDELLQRILSILDWHPTLFKLAPCYLFCMSVEYSSVMYEQVHTRQLLLKIASRVQTAVLDRTKLLAECQTDQTMHPAEAMDALLPDIQPILLWLSNSLEILHFLHTRMREYLLEPAVSLPAETRVSIAGAEDEVMAVLEDVVMYTFQQSVYYITKTLYTALPALLESNPFNEDDSGSERSGMDTLLSIYQTTLHTLLEYNAHPQILSQLFCYLFFFTDTSLINTLMTTDGATRYYKWSSGVRLRGNLDALEAWACDNHLQEEASGYLKKLNNLVDLLATPIVQLLQADWSSLRADYPHLSAAQLHNVLSKYSLGASRQRPTRWQPTEEDRDAARNEEMLMESFNNHPALVLPDKGFSLDLRLQVTDLMFYDVVREIESLFGGNHLQEDKGDAYLSEEDYSRELSIAALKAQRLPSNGLQQKHIPQDLVPTYSLPSPPPPKPQVPRLDLECPSPNPSLPPPPTGVAIGGVPWYKQNVSPQTETKESPWSSRDSDVRSLLKDSGISSLKPGHSNEYMHETEQSETGEKVSNLVYAEILAAASNHSTTNYPGFDHVHSNRVKSNKGFSLDGNLSSNQFLSGNAGDILENKKVRTADQLRFVYDFEEHFIDSDSVGNQGHNGKKSNQSGQRYLNTNTGPTNNSEQMTTQEIDEEPCYMNIEDFNEQERNSMSVVNSIAGVRNSFMQNDQRTITPDPIAMSTPLTSSQNSTNTSPSDVLSKLKGYLPVPSSSRTPTVHNIVNQRSPTNHFISPSEENVVKVEQSSLSPRATGSGLRVLPLTTDDHSKQTSHQDQLRRNSSHVRESELDQFLFNKGRIEGRVSSGNSNNLADYQTKQYGGKKNDDDVILVELEKNNKGLGMGLIDGIYTPHAQPGIYVRTLVQGGAASQDGRVKIGDRILAVNNDSIVGSDYQTAMNMIKNGGQRIKFRVAKSDRMTAMQISASSC